MIHWWAIPIVCVLAAAGLLQLLASDCNMPYRGLMVIAVAITLAPFLAVIWLLCFILSLFN